MNLIISGMALSCQTWPSLKHFEDNLTGVTLQHPASTSPLAEVILQALIEADVSPAARISLILNSSTVDCEHHLAHLTTQFCGIDQVEPVSGAMGAILRQADGLLGKDPQRHAIICSHSPNGTTALLLSHPDQPGAAYARIHGSGEPGVDPASADYVLLPGSPLPDDSGIVNDLKDLFSNRTNNHPVALGYGDAAEPYFPEILSLVQAALAVRWGLIPASSDQPDPLVENILETDFLFFNREFRPWLSHGREFKRIALQVFRAPAEKPEMFILEEVSAPAALALRLRESSDPVLFPLSGSDRTELLENLNLLERKIQGPDPLQILARNAYATYSQRRKAFTCTLLARNREEILKEIGHARTGINRAFDTGKAWNSPAGSCFTAQPLGKAGIALVYPGAFNSYPGMGRELFFSFPGLTDAAREWIPDPSHSLAEEFLYLRSSRATATSNDSIMADFYQHPKQLIESGISLSLLYTQILTQLFAVPVDAALGYSLGEISMLWANRVWQNAGESSESWMDSDLFEDQLFGEMKAVRKYWKDRVFGEDFWASYILKADRTRAEEQCDQEQMVFLSIVNTPDEVVIAGERNACLRVIQSLKCRAIPMPFNAVIHNPTMQQTRSAFRRLYTHPTHPVTGIRFYSAARYEQLTLTEESLADAMAAMTTNPVDFPRVVHQAYCSGVRIFIEVGPQKTCSRWIEHILGDQPHAAIPINKKYQSDLTGVLKVLSLLISHGVAIHLEPLYLDQVCMIPEKPARPESSQPAAIPTLQTAAPHPGTALQEQDKSYLEHLDRVSTAMARSHQVYLKTQRILTRNLTHLMEIQASNLSRVPKPDPANGELYSRRQIEAFARGNSRECFGSSFSEFGGRRIPRLPNGDLLFIDRILTIRAQKERVEERSELISEFDLPEHAWYRNGAAAPLSHVSIMEVALQPCGFLSAYMGTIKGRGSQDLYFRNLDGEGTLLAWPETHGSSITNRVTLLSSSTLESMIIQKYSFLLSWEGEPFYRGTTSFGYFPHQMLESQAGLDGRHTNRTWFETNPEKGNWVAMPSQPDTEPSQARLPAIDRLWFSSQGGKYSNGVVYFTQELSPADWFYTAHFYQDPVMPGSLGVETISRGLMAAAPNLGVPSDLLWRIKPDTSMAWKYRGQITPDVPRIRIEIHLKSITRTPSGWELCADGHLWKDNLRIYQVENLSLQSCRRNEEKT